MDESTYVKCGACVHWSATSWDGRFGECGITLPPWLPKALAEDGDGQRETGEWDGCDLGHAKPQKASG